MSNRSYGQLYTKLGLHICIAVAIYLRIPHVPIFKKLVTDLRKLPLLKITSFSLPYLLNALHYTKFYIIE